MILVAGGSGRLGGELVPLLGRGGERVRVLTRNPARTRERLDPAVEVVAGDVRDQRSLVEPMRGVDAVVSAITGFGPGAPGPRAVDFEGNVNLIQAAEGAGVARFVLISVVGAGPAHPMELMRMKHRAEEALRSSTLDWRIVRATAFLELWAGVVGDPIAAEAKTTVFGRGKNPINFVSVIDVANVALRALSDPALRHDSLEVGGPYNMTFNELVERIGRVTGRDPKTAHVPLPVMRMASLGLRPFKPDIAGMIAAGIVMDTTDMTFDSAALRSRYPELRTRDGEEVIRAIFGKRGAPANERATTLRTS